MELSSVFQPQQNTTHSTTSPRKRVAFCLLILILLISLINLGYMFIEKLNKNHFNLIVQRILKHPTKHHQQ